MSLRKGKFLSPIGRLILIKSSLSSVPLFYMSMFPMPIRVGKEIERLMKVFLWAGRSEGHYMTKVGSKEVHMPFDVGGLAIRRLLKQN